jgi:hypothetical protein
MLRRAAGAALVSLVAVVAAACTGDGISIELGSPGSSASVDPPGPGGGITLDVEPVETGRAKAAAAMRELCVAPVATPTDDDGAPDETPPEIAEVEAQVEQVRELGFLEPVVVQPVTPDEIAAKLEEAFDETYPRTFYDRRTVAWQTAGVIPRDVTIREALLAFQTGQVIGFYNPVDGELVFVAGGDLDLFERVTLAHELTHAIDDQHFDLSRIDRPAETCRDEAFQAALGAVEGSAQFFSTRLLFEFPPEDGDFSGLGGGGAMPDGVPPFMVDQALWPYTAGQSFVTDLEAGGGVAAIDDALRRFPTTTEQVLHPERYPGDSPSRVDVPDLGDELGPGWGDLDVMQVGESWLDAMLSLRMEGATAEAAAAGWDGGVYRAFTDGEDALVVFDTAWDTQGDADAFAQAMRDWFAAGGTTGAVGGSADRRVAFAMATDEAVLAASGVSPG